MKNNYMKHIRTLIKEVSVLNEAVDLLFLKLGNVSKNKETRDLMNYSMLQALEARKKEGEKMLKEVERSIEKYEN